MKYKISKLSNRIIASIVDGGFFVLLWFFSILFYELGYYWQIFGNAMFLLFEYLYFVEYVFRNSNTIGKRIEGLKIRSYDSAPLSRIQCLVRYLSYAIVSILYFFVESTIVLYLDGKDYYNLGLFDKLDYAMNHFPELNDIYTYASLILLLIHSLFIVLHPERKSLADYMAGTIVVSDTSISHETKDKIPANV